MFFCLSFVDQENSTQLKTMFLEQHRDAFFSIFRGLAQDPFVVIRKVLEICWTGIWLDPKIKRTLKIGLFSEITVAQVVVLPMYSVYHETETEPPSSSSKFTSERIAKTTMRSMCPQMSCTISSSRFAPVLELVFASRIEGGIRESPKQKVPKTMKAM